MSSTSYGESPYSWYTFNIPPFGSTSERGIGYELANAYFEAGFESKVVLANPARWQKDMTNPKNNEFCSTGSWKLPKTSHRVYSDSILNTVDYGVAVRPELYKKLSNNGETRVVSISDVIEATKTSGNMLILDGRPVFGEMGNIIEKNKNEKNTKIHYMTAAEGPVTLLKMANTPNREVDSVLIFPEEYTVFDKQNSDHTLEYLMLKEGSSFAPIRASCPDTQQGRMIVSEINKLLNNGLRDKIFVLFQKALPDISEIQEKAAFNQHCIKNGVCRDPLIDSMDLIVK